jgi:dTDP-3-amino-3,4,6-trideoxy-alpha-D-glucose transaminase
VYVIPLSNLAPAIEETRKEWQALLDRMIARSQFILGEQVAAFERDFASAAGAVDCVGTGTGTDAIQLCLRAAGITSRKQEVITSTLTAPFTGIAILAAGATPRFADVDPRTLLLDPESVARSVTKRTAAILPVHLYGQTADLSRLSALAKDAGLVLIQDACQAHGATFRGKPLTHYSPYVAYSFYPTKNLGCLGDGGAVATSSKAIAARIRRLRDGGRGRNHVSLTAGINSRLDEIQACFLNAFLPHLDEWNRLRAQIASWYDAALQDCRAARPLQRGVDGVYHLYVVRARRRDRLRNHLHRHGIVTGVHYPVPLHRQPAFRVVQPVNLPVADKASREILSLPLWPHMSRENVQRVTDLIRAF